MIGLFIAVTILHLIGLFYGIVVNGLPIELFYRFSIWIIFVNFTLYGRITREFDKIKKKASTGEENPVPASKNSTNRGGVY